MGLRDIGASLPPGFRFYPSDEELVCHYLFQKTLLYQSPPASSSNNSNNTLVEIDLHTCEPWQLPEIAKLNSHEWYFFSFRDRKYATGFRTNRATTTGYWKATGKDRTILDPITKSIVGMRKTLVFYKNRAPNGIKTSWIMHEFRLENPNLPPKEDWVLCRVFEKPKSETNSGELSPTTYDNCTNNATPAASSPTFATSPPPLDHSFAGSSYQYNISSSIRDCPPTIHDQRNNQSDSDIMNITNFPFFFGMNLGGIISEEDGGAPVVLDDMQFDMDLDMDGSMVFI